MHMFTYFVKQPYQHRYEKSKILFDNFILNYAYRCSNVNASCTYSRLATRDKVENHVSAADS